MPVSDASDYFRAYAVRALNKARVMNAGWRKSRQRLIGRLYRLLAKQADRQPNLHHLDDFHAARTLEASLDQDGRPAVTRPPRDH